MKQDGCACLCRGLDVSVNGGSRADTQPTSGVLCDQHCRASGELAGYDQLLLIAAAQRRRWSPRACSDDLIPAEQVGSAGSSLSPIEMGSPYPGSLSAKSQCDIFRERKRGDQAFGGSVLRDEANRSSNLEPSSERHNPPSNRSKELPLTVTLDSRDSNDLSSVDGQSRVPHRDTVTTLPRDLESFQVNSGTA